MGKRADFGKPMPSGKEAVEFEDGQFQKQLHRELKGAERTKCNENHDIRQDGIKGDPFTPSGRKVVDRIIKSSEKPSVGRDADLHSDTTEPGENKVSPMQGKYARSLTESGEKEVKMQKDKKVADATKAKVFNS